VKNDYEVFWICKTNVTREKIQKDYNITVYLDYKKLEYNDFDIIVISVPPYVQWKISVFIIENWYKNKLILEYSIVFNIEEFKKLHRYDNIFFFLEEYYSMLNRFLKKINIEKIEEFLINIKINNLNNIDFKNIYLKHITNNFLWFDIDKNKFKSNFILSKSTNLDYSIIFNYNWIINKFYFWNETYLKIWDKYFYDNWNFNKNLDKFLIEINNNNNLFNINYEN